MQPRVGGGGEYFGLSSVIPRAYFKTNPLTQHPMRGGYRKRGG